MLPATLFTSSKVSAAILAPDTTGALDDKPQEALNRRLVRPQLQLGDGLLFDTRILHFGLANQAAGGKAPAAAAVTVDSDGAVCGAFGEEGWRPMLYVNYHQSWFHDPKNWNDKVSLFD